MKKYLQMYKNLPIQVKASMWFLICSFLQKGISTITTPIFTRILTTTEYGQYSVFTSWMQIITPIVCLNLYAGVYSQGVVKLEEDRNQYSSSLQGLFLILIAGWTMVYLSSHRFWNNLLSLTTIQMLAMFVMIWASGSFNFWSTNQRVDFQYRKLVLLTLIVSIFQPSLSILFILNSEYKVTARILGMAVVQFVLFSGTFIVQMVKGKKFFSKYYWSYALKLSIPLLPHYLSINILSSSDRIMIGTMVGNDQAGIYNLAHSVALIMTLFNTALLQTIEPWIYRKLKAKCPKDIAKVAYPSFIAIAGLNILLIMFAPEVIRIFAPEAYLEAIWIIPGVALSVFFTFLYTFFATFEFYYEKTSYIASATVGGAVLNIILNYVCIKQFGYIAAAYTTLFSYIIFAVLHYNFMRKICRDYMDNVKPYNLCTIIEISVTSIIVGLALMLVYPYVIIRYSLILVILILMFLMRKSILNMLKIIVTIKGNKNQP